MSSMSASDPFPSSDSKLPLTPCVGVCYLDASGLCAGCRRSGDEIARWTAMSRAERLYLMEHVLPLRDAPT